MHKRNATSSRGHKTPSEAHPFSHETKSLSPENHAVAKPKVPPQPMQRRRQRTSSSNDAMHPTGNQGQSGGAVTNPSCPTVPTKQPKNHNEHSRNQKDGGHSKTKASDKHVWKPLKGEARSPKGL
jgi:hypothetical protein